VKSFGVLHRTVICCEFWGFHGVKVEAARCSETLLSYRNTTRSQHLEHHRPESCSTVGSNQ